MNSIAYSIKTRKVSCYTITRSCIMMYVFYFFLKCMQFWSVLFTITNKVISVRLVYAVQKLLNSSIIL